ncbi:hypothetical protein MTO96_015325 [Rhipicephalus appendiculatus]
MKQEMAAHFLGTGMSGAAWIVTGACALPFILANPVLTVEGVCLYTKEQFKNHKLSDAYNSFLSGEVQRVMSFTAGKRGVGVVLLTASVEAGQQLSKAYRPWCIVEDDGTVVSAHCTCMAG